MTSNILVISIFNNVTTLTIDTITVSASNILSILTLRVNRIVPGILLKEIYAILLPILFARPRRSRFIDTSKPNLVSPNPSILKSRLKNETHCM